MSISFQAKDANILSKQLAFQSVIIPVTDSNLYVVAATTRLDINEPMIDAFVVAYDAAGAAVVTLAATLQNSVAGVANSAVSVTTAALAGYEYLCINYRVNEAV